MTAAESGPAPTIVFVHALGSSSRAWAPQLVALGDRYRVRALDLPGHGDAPGPFTLKRAVAAVHARVGETEAVHVVGISGGAAVALLAALDEPARVRSLVLSGGFAHVPRLFPLQRALIAALPWRLYTVASRGFYSGGNPEYAEAAREDLQRCGKRGILAMLRELAQLDLRGRLGEVTVPTLVLCGARDRPNIPGSRELAARIPEAELRIVSGANHLWNLQQPDLFNETVDGFVRQASSGGTEQA
jgi:3-oxoadipate enol-lactonase